jgi:excisionase family DNA binding protein
MPRYTSQTQAAKHFQTTDRTIRNWIGKGYIKGYRIGPRSVVVDLDEIERFLATVPPTVARDGRRVYGPDARIVNLSGVVIEADQ